MHSPCELTQLCTVTPRRAPGETCQVHTVQRSRSSDEFGFTHYISGIFVRSQVLINQNLGSLRQTLYFTNRKVQPKVGWLPRSLCGGWSEFKLFPPHTFPSLSFNSFFTSSSPSCCDCLFAISNLQSSLGSSTELPKPFSQTHHQTAFPTFANVLFKGHFPQNGFSLSGLVTFPLSQQGRERQWVPGSRAVWEVRLR